MKLPHKKAQLKDYFEMPNMCFCSFRDLEIENQLWIGLYDQEYFHDEENTCSCVILSGSQTECDRCRERFVWVDETPVNEDFAPWLGSEPSLGEKCVRLTDSDTNQRWSGSPCSTKFDYVCSKGIKLTGP